MVAVKAHQTASFLKALDPAIVVAIVYGTDPGLIREMADLASKAMAARSNPPGEILRIEEADLDETPDRLIVELQTIPMFAGAKVVRTATGRRINAAMLKPLFEEAPPTSALVVEAGNLKPTDAVRKLAETRAWAVAIPCYADSTRDLSSIVDEELRGAGQTLDPDARAILLTRLGADRGLSRAEVAKLSLYAHGRETITAHDVDAVVGDASAMSLDKIVLAAQEGRAADALHALNQALGAGQTAQSALLALQRHFLMLHSLRASVDGGRRAEEAVRGLRPPLHFSVRDAVIGALSRWPMAALTQVVARIETAIRDTRSATDLDTAMTERVVLEIARLASRAGTR